MYLSSLLSVKWQSNMRQFGAILFVVGGAAPIHGREAIVVPGGGPWRAVLLLLGRVVTGLLRHLLLGRGVLLPKVHVSDFKPGLNRHSVVLTTLIGWVIEDGA